MPVVVACRCGKRFAAKDHLYGRHLRCPACNNELTIEHHADAPADGVYVACACGRAFLAPETMRGQQARCRGCGRILQVPGRDPLAIVPVSAPRAAAPPMAVAAPACDDNEIPWTTLKRIGVVGGSILLTLIVITTLIEYWPRKLPVPKAEHISKLVETARQKLAPPPAATPAAGEAEASETSATDASATERPDVAASAGKVATSLSGAKPPTPRTKTATKSRFEPLPIPRDTVIIKLERPERLTISPDGKLLLVVAAEGACLFDISWQEPRPLDALLSWENGMIKHMPHAAAFAPDNETLVMAFPDGASLVKVPDLHTVRMRVPAMMANRHVRFSGDGGKVYGLMMGACFLFDVASGDLKTFAFTSSVTQDDVAIEPEAGKVLAANQTGIVAHSVGTGETTLYHRFSIPEEKYKLVGMSHNGKWVAGFTNDRIDLWDVAQKRIGASCPLTDPEGIWLSSPRITGDGRFVIATDHYKLHVWDTTKQAEVARWDVGGLALRDFVLADEGRRIAACEGFHTNEVRVFALPK